MVERSNEEVTVRRLPGGPVWPAHQISCEGRTLRLEIDSPFDSPSPFEIGDAAEIQSRDYIYLGEVLSYRANTVVIGAEHAIERKALAEIEPVWRPAAQGVST